MGVTRDELNGLESRLWDAASSWLSGVDSGEPPQAMRIAADHLPMLCRLFAVQVGRLFANRWRGDPGRYGPDQLRRAVAGASAMLTSRSVAGSPPDQIVEQAADLGNWSMFLAYWVSDRTCDAVIPPPAQPGSHTP